MKEGVDEVSVFHIKTLSPYFHDREGRKIPKLESKCLSSLSWFDQRMEEKESIREEMDASVPG